MRIAFLSSLALCLAAVPAMAQVVYSNGPINGTTDAWTINSGFVVSDNFYDDGDFFGITDLAFGAWLMPGDVLESVQVSITSSEFGGTVYDDEVVHFTQSGCSGNQFGFNVCTETGSLATGPNLAAGTYWLNLQNAVTASSNQNGVTTTGDPIYWDENSGPSSASESSVGTIPSEAFTILGEATDANTTASSAPEPCSFLLLGSGVLALFGYLSRKLF